ncbi:MoxR-like ATPase [Kibdelosporangium banguiense]|uniref:MoxR-like ATPase n=1 Tax=Kibdelosporangium banguiense TaxID=1365924 RepID=A0ABS4U0H0_9PSEU|nr:MoxR family ATPase [Kibdelosporangium banguiense]MBP2330142.1 MoxR-like ATPase [Kibdelosporangium banguiense]
MTAWPIYQGTGIPHDGIEHLPSPPNWRAFDGGPNVANPAIDQDASTSRRLGSGHTRTSMPEEIQMVNAALYLRRPLLITGRPGTGKSTLAYAVAKELKLGPVLRWPITSRSTLLDGLYHYDPIGRLREENLRQLRRRTDSTDSGEDMAEDIGQHLRLGPLGTALLPYARPRVLLIDEIDKSDIDLPNDLLNVFEEGEFEIDELSRLPREVAEVEVMTADRDVHATVTRGQVACNAFPFVVLTSNGEREFPPAFLRRCLRLDMREPSAKQIHSILAAHFGPDAAVAAQQHIVDFLERRKHAEVTTDQLLNAVYLATSGSRHATGDPGSFNDMVDAVLRPVADSEPR